MLVDTVVSSLLLITYCNQSRDYSVGNVESLVNSDGVGENPPFQYCNYVHVCVQCAEWRHKTPKPLYELILAVTVMKAAYHLLCRH